MHESLHPLQGFERDLTCSSGVLLRAPSGFTYELTVFRPPLAVVRWKLWREHSSHALPLTGNVIWDESTVTPDSCIQTSNTSVQLRHGNLVIDLDYSSAPHLTIYKSAPFSDQRGFQGAISGAADLFKDRPDVGHRHVPYGQSKIMYKDLPHQALTVMGTGIAQYSLLHPLNAVHFGLGEKAAPLDLTKRKFSLGATDAANYDAFRTDPLYKHHPLLFTVPRPPATELDGDTPPPDSRGLPPVPAPDANGEGFAILQFNNSNSDGEWDIGKLTNEPLGRFKKYTANQGGMECYLIFGRDVAEISDVYAQMVGPPRLPSRHWMGYLASSMALADSEDPPAQYLLEEFPVKCQEEGIPCSVMHLSSGYTVSMKEPKNRYVFTLNTKRYPDFEGMIKTFHKSGIKISPNIKPFVLCSHPDFERLSKAGAFFTDPETDGPATTRIWSAQPGETEQGCWLDMTSHAARQWWYEGCKKLAEAGCDSLWNDNNEFSLASDNYLAACELGDRNELGVAAGPQPVGSVGRLLNATLMAKVSHEALSSVEPNRRTMVLTRSANISTMRFASSTWSGDNYTSWDTIKGNVAMGLQAGMALMHSYGHDVGGFGGPLPTMEMFVRWVQICVWNPRFCIHSFKPDLDDLSGPGRSNSPWMFPEATPIIRKCIERRYELIPYLYSLHWEGYRHATPPNAWLGWGAYERDPHCFTEDGLSGTAFWVGVGRILVAGAFQPGQKAISVHLPRDSRLPLSLDYYYDLGGDDGIYRAGQTIEFPTTLESIVILVHVGSAIPIGKAMVTVTALNGLSRSSVTGSEADVDSDKGVVALDDWRGLEIYPPPKGHSSSPVYHSEWTEDDGETVSQAEARISVDFFVESDGIVVEARWARKDFKPLWDCLWIILPQGDTRTVANATGVEAHGADRLSYAVKVI